mgnify:CR=1 FL=1|jgi:ABC-type antimicrobial peptide transport system permease subunit
MDMRQGMVDGGRVVRTGQAVIVGLGGYLLALPVGVIVALLLCPMP